MIDPSVFDEHSETCICPFCRAIDTALDALGDFDEKPVRSLLASIRAEHARASSEEATTADELEEARISIVGLEGGIKRLVTCMKEVAAELVKRDSALAKSLASKLTDIAVKYTD